MDLKNELHRKLSLLVSNERDTSSLQEKLKEIEEKLENNRRENCSLSTDIRNIVGVLKPLDEIVFHAQEFGETYIYDRRGQYIKKADYIEPKPVVS